MSHFVPKATYKLPVNYKEPERISQFVYGKSNAKDRRRLIEMLQTRRPYGSRSERKFIAKYIDILDNVEIDGKGNRIIRIGDSPILWSSHTDTVHNKGGTQQIKLTKGMITISTKSNSNCLGADDTAGVFLMLEMIRAGVPGLYIFHRGEEHGGIGSEFISQQTPELLDGIKYAIALDRKDYGSVITDMCYGGEVCSQEFACGLAALLNMGTEFTYSPDNTGGFTDTANYESIIPECTNISIGYFDQHKKCESLDSDFLFMLRDRLCAITAKDIDSLPCERDPLESMSYQLWESNIYGDSWSYANNSGNMAGVMVKRKNAKGDWIPWNESESTPAYQARFGGNQLAAIIADYPDITAEVLEEYGITVDDMLQVLYEKLGYIPQI